MCHPSNRLTSSQGRNQSSSPERATFVAAVVAASNAMQSARRHVIDCLVDTSSRCASSETVGASNPMRHKASFAI